MTPGCDDIPENEPDPTVPEIRTGTDTGLSDPLAEPPPPQTAGEIQAYINRVAGALGTFEADSGTWEGPYEQTNWKAYYAAGDLVAIEEELTIDGPPGSHAMYYFFRNSLVHAMRERRLSPGGRTEQIILYFDELGDLLEASRLVDGEREAVTDEHISELIQHASELRAEAENPTDSLAGTPANAPDRSSL